MSIICLTVPSPSSTWMPWHVDRARNGHIVTLSQVDDPAHIVAHDMVFPHMWNVYFWVDDMEALFGELKERGVTIHYELGLVLIYVVSEKPRWFMETERQVHDTRWPLVSLSNTRWVGCWRFFPGWSSTIFESAIANASTVAWGGRQCRRVA